MPKASKNNKQPDLVPNNLTVYDKRDIFNKEILPKVLELNALCIKSNIPYFAAFAVANNVKKTTYKYSGISPSYIDVVLKTDNYAKHVCVSRGFDIKIPGVNDDDEKIINSIQTFTPSEDINV